MTPSRWIILIAVIMSAFLVFMAVDHEQRRQNGAEIILDMEPVDPRSLFRGHYVIIRTDLHRLNKDLPHDEITYKKGQTIYVSLKEGEQKNWIPVSYHHTRPKNDEYVIKGRIKHNRNTLRVVYNIESYFADKKNAKALENQVREHKMRLIVSLSKDGRAVIKGIEVDGKRQLDTLY